MNTPASNQAASAFKPWHLADDCWSSLLSRNDARVRAMLEKEMAVSTSVVQEQSPATLESIIASGWLLAALPNDLGGIDLGAGGPRAHRSVDALLWLSRESLATAQLFESHVQAVRLIHLFGTSDQIRHLQRSTLDGRCARVLPDASHRQVALSDDALRLSGLMTDVEPKLCKRWLVVVRARWRNVEQLCLLGLPGTSHDADVAASRDKKIELSTSNEMIDTTIFSRLGEPGNARREPWFNGGLWRSAVLLLGPLLNFLDIAKMTFDQHPQRAKQANSALLPVLAKAMGARRVIEDAAQFAEGAVGEHYPNDAVVMSKCAQSLVLDGTRHALKVVFRESQSLQLDRDSSLERAAKRLRPLIRQKPMSTQVARAHELVFNEFATVSGFDPIRTRTVD